jgi:capsular exopolysaccharide synthesis family protein
MRDHEIGREMTFTDQRLSPHHDMGVRAYARILWRHKLLVLGSLIAGLCTAQLVRLATIPRYEAESQVILDVRNTTILKFDAVVSALPQQFEVVRTEMDFIGSRAMAERVLDHLSAEQVKQLADDGAMATPLSRFFAETGPVLLDRLLKRIPLPKQLAATTSAAQGRETQAGDAESASARREDLINLIMQDVKISNDGRSYTIHISFASPHPKLAAELANTYAEQYMANQLDSKADAMKRANELLSQRLVELRRELEGSETAVETYRRAAGMLGNQAGTIITQQITEINVELAAARNQRIEAESRLRAVRAQIAGGGDPEALADVISSQGVQSLRAARAELKRQQAQLNSQYTAKYPNTKTLQTDIGALQSQIADEIKRVVGSLENQVTIARNKEQGLQADLTRLETQFGQGSVAGVKLQQLQREADANRAVYEAYLNRIKELNEQQQLQSADARLVSRATVPGVPTYPRYRPVLILGVLAGGVIGIVLAFLRETFDQRLRSIGEVEDVTGLPVLALLPSLPRLRLARPEDYVLRRGRRASPFNEALRTAWAGLLLASSQPRGASGLVYLPGVLPTFRRRRRPASAGIVILVTSSVPNEGKTAFCLSMARSLAADGHKVLLIDGDLRRPGVAKSFGSSTGGRMTELLEGKIELQDAVQLDGKSGAHYLAARHDGSHPQDVLNSIRTEIVLDKARRNYDIVLIDTPPILVAADAAIVAKFCDRCVFFVRWGATSRERVVNALRRLMLYNVRVSGVVLSHVNLRRHAQYATGEGYYRPYGQVPQLPPIAQA